MWAAWRAWVSPVSAPTTCSPRFSTGCYYGCAPRRKMPTSCPRPPAARRGFLARRLSIRDQRIRLLDGPHRLPGMPHGSGMQREKRDAPRSCRHRRSGRRQRGARCTSVGCCQAGRPRPWSRGAVESAGLPPHDATPRRLRIGGRRGHRRAVRRFPVAPLASARSTLGGRATGDRRAGWNSVRNVPLPARRPATGESSREITAATAGNRQRPASQSEELPATAARRSGTAVVVERPGASRSPPFARRYR